MKIKYLTFEQQIDNYKMTTKQILKIHQLYNRIMLHNN